jgi:hypothetical protein
VIADRIGSSLAVFKKWKRRNREPSAEDSHQSLVQDGHINISFQEIQKVIMPEMCLIDFQKFFLIKIEKVLVIQKRHHLASQGK